MSAQVDGALGRFAVEFHNELTEDNQRQRSRRDLIGSTRTAAQLRQAEDQRASAIIGAVGKALDSASSVASGVGELGPEVKTVSKRVNWTSTQAGRIADALESERADRASEEAPVASAARIADSAIDRSEASIKQNQRLVMGLIAQSRQA